MMSEPAPTIIELLKRIKQLEYDVARLLTAFETLALITNKRLDIIKERLRKLEEQHD